MPTIKVPKAALNDPLIIRVDWEPESWLPIMQKMGTDAFFQKEAKILLEYLFQAVPGGLRDALLIQAHRLCERELHPAQWEE